MGDYGVSIGGKIAFGIHNGTSGSGICSSASVTDGKWHHIAITRQFSSGKVVLFIDGKVDVISNMPIGNIYIMTAEQAATSLIRIWY